jgi:cephalosporin hydroxylase
MPVRLGSYSLDRDQPLHPTYADFGPGPMETVDRFLAENRDFVVDERCERLMMTLHPRGYLTRRGR